MTWPLALVAGVVVVAYGYLRQRLRRWIVAGWVADRFSNRQVAAMLVLTYVAPLVALGAWIGVTTAGVDWPTLAAMTLLVTVLIAGIAGLLDYASARGLKTRMRKDMAGR